MRLTLLFLPLLVVFSGCSNPFFDNYNGQTYPKVKFAEAALEPPPDARKIGESDFTSDAQDWSQSDAINAAKSVGADVVVWRRREAGERTEIQDETVYSKKSDSGTETKVQIPVKIRKMFYRYTAEFYRTDSSSE
jgi:hypothetical protein